MADWEGCHDASLSEAECDRDGFWILLSVDAGYILHGCLVILRRLVLRLGCEIMSTSYREQSPTRGTPEELAGGNGTNDQSADTSRIVTHMPSCHRRDEIYIVDTFS